VPTAAAIPAEAIAARLTAGGGAARDAAVTLSAAAVTEKSASSWLMAAATSGAGGGVSGSLSGGGVTGGGGAAKSDGRFERPAWRTGAPPPGRADRIIDGGGGAATGDAMSMLTIDALAADSDGAIVVRHEPNDANKNSAACSAPEQTRP